MHFFYSQKSFTAEQVGHRIARVECSKCGCEYFYQLTRIGSGRGIAPYGVGVEGAKRSADEESQRDLDRRLRVEAELVPCPKCNWINDDLVNGYRRGQYVVLVGIAALVGLFGTLISLILAWFISRGPAADRTALPYLLIGGPTLFISLAAGLILIRTWLQSRIRPNRDFPLPPKLPPGSPPALLKNQFDGKLAPANVEHLQVSVSSDWLDFRIGRHTLPLVCCGCLQPTTMEHAFKREVTSTLQLQVPRCEACARSATRKSRIIFWVTVAAGTVVAAAVSVSLQLKADEIWMLCLAFLPVAILVLGIGTWAASKATDPVRVAGDVSRGVLRLRFRNVEYARIVAKHIKDSSQAA
jgi:hypothetical protein